MFYVYLSDLNHRYCRGFQDQEFSKSWIAEVNEE